MAGSHEDDSVKPTGGGEPVRKGHDTTQTLCAVLLALILALAVGGGVVIGLGYLPQLGGVGSAADGAFEQLPTPDAMASVRIRQNIDDVFLYATTPGSWPHWHKGSEMVSGDISTVVHSVWYRSY